LPAKHGKGGKKRPLVDGKEKEKKNHPSPVILYVYPVGKERGGGELHALCVKRRGERCDSLVGRGKKNSEFISGLRTKRSRLFRRPKENKRKKTAARPALPMRMKRREAAAFTNGKEKGEKKKGKKETSGPWKQGRKKGKWRQPFPKRKRRENFFCLTRSAEKKTERGEPDEGRQKKKKSGSPQPFLCRPAKGERGECN